MPTQPEPGGFESLRGHFTALLLRVPDAREWLLGAGKAAAALTADSFELFRAYRGGAAAISSNRWRGRVIPIRS